jgi:putative DNA primase/helicase
MVSDAEAIEEKNLKYSEKVSTASTTSTSKDFEGTDPARSQHRPALNQHKPSIKEDSLINVIKTKDGEKKSLLIESKAALIVKKALSRYFAHDLDSKTWHKFVGTHWLPLDVQQFFDNTLIDLMYVGAGDLGFKPAYKNGVKTLLTDGDMLPLSKNDGGKLPFTNGLLNLQTRALELVTSSNAMTWCLPYKYESGADCRRVKAWLLQAVDGDKETVKFLQAFMAAVLHGRNDLQKFLHLKGSGGTGKGTLMRLLTVLVGVENAVSTSLQHLEQNRFETALLYNKRLAVITESDKYGGSINVLKAITGQDHIRLERKHQQQAGSFIFPGMVVIASNESLQVTDHTSGLDRRRITVIFDRRATDKEKQDWASRGGEEAVLHAELPGLVNWLLELSQDEISEIIRNPPQRISDANREAMAASNPIADWVLECCKFDPNAQTQIGDKREIREPGRETGYENADRWLYANYLQWSQRNNKSPLMINRFSELLIDTCKTLGHEIEKGRLGKGRVINGLGLLNNIF